MPLSEYEQQILAQMEAQLRSEDPALVSAMQTSKAKRDPRRIGLGVAGGLLGVVLLVGGLTLGYSWVGISLSVLGFFIMFGSVLLIVARPKKKLGAGAGSAGRPSATKSPSGSSGFMKRQEERWEKRREEE